MPKAGYQQKRCRVCGRGNPRVNVSTRGLCLDCRLERQLTNNAQLEEKDGPFYDHWARRSFMKIRREVLDIQERLAQEIAAD